MSNKTGRRSYRRPKLTRAQRLRRRAKSDRKKKVRSVHDVEAFAQEEALAAQKETEYYERLRKVREKLEASNLTLSGRFKDGPKPSPERSFIEAILGLMSPDTMVQLNPCRMSSGVAEMEGRLAEQMGIDMEELLEGGVEDIQRALYGGKVVKGEGHEESSGTREATEEAPEAPHEESESASSR